MSQRIEGMLKTVLRQKYAICTEKARIVTESWKETEGEPDVIRVAKAQAKVLDNLPIFIEDDELIVGNAASKPMAAELATGSICSKADLEGLAKEGLWEIAKEDLAEIESLNEYWRPRTRYDREIKLHDEERLWPFRQSGWILPPFKTKEGAKSLGYAIAGVWAFSAFDMGMGVDNLSVPWDRAINNGCNYFVREAEEELKKIDFNDPGSVKKVYFLQAAIIVHKAVIRWANRFADLAEDMASKEKNPARKKELEKIAENCRWVPANSPRSFHEAIQSLWFFYVLLQHGITPFQRFDQYMYPYYKKDIEEGRTADDEVLELLQCLRIKDMQLIGTTASAHRDKYSGMAKWNNMVIGGQTPDGKDATNELTFLVLEAVKRCPTPHHTITVRVHEGTPEALMLKALEVVKTGIGMPAFVGDKSYIEYFLTKHVPIDKARDYYLIGCVEGAVPEGCTQVFPLTANTIAFNWLVHNGFDSHVGKQIGPKTGDFASFKTFNDVMKAFKQQYVHGMTMEAEVRNIGFQVRIDQFPSSFSTSMFTDGIKVGKSDYERTLPYKVYSTMCPAVGIINMADSLAAIKKLVFDEKKITMKELKEALVANWKGYEHIREMCLKAPKYGNDDDYVDSIVKDLYQFFADTAATLDGPRYGRDGQRQKYNVGAISISSHQPAGALTMATPDGRYAGEILADACASPAQGMDTHAPTGVIKSASKINQSQYQSMLLNMKFHPSALKTTEDMRKLSALIRIYFSLGGKHIQFNVVDRDTLIDAQKLPEKHRDLIVRVAGYSAYYVQLTKGLQDEIIKRMEHEQVSY